MTGLYEWNVLPHVLSVSCPACGCEAQFEFAETVAVQRRTDVAYFKRSEHFEYHFRGEGFRAAHHFATYYHGLGGVTLAAVDDLPDGYQAEDWAHSRYFWRSGGKGERGAIMCAGCGLRKKHELDWPHDAYFQTDHRGHLLWAFNREALVDLRDFVASEQRRFEDYTWGWCLRHVPAVFLTAKARSAVVKKLDRLL